MSELRLPKAVVEASAKAVWDHGEELHHKQIPSHEIVPWGQGETGHEHEMRAEAARVLEAALAAWHATVDCASFPPAGGKPVTAFRLRAYYAEVDR